VDQRQPRGQGGELRMTPADIRAHDPGKLIVRLEGRLAGIDAPQHDDAVRKLTAWPSRSG
jgi:hypothetical protein